MSITYKISDRSRAATLVLACLLGIFGVHRVFAGYKKIGLMQLTMTLSSLSMMMVVYLFNRDLFNEERIIPLSIHYYLLVNGLMILFFIPFMIILGWVIVDIIRLLLNHFYDGDGARIELWFSKGSF